MLSKLCIASLLFAAAPAIADDDKSPVRNDGGVTVWTGEVGSTGDDEEHPAACGTVIFDTFTPGGGANVGTGWTISDGFAGIWQPAHQFSVPSNGTICEVQVVLAHVTGPNSYDVVVYQDSGGLPGAQVQRVNVAAANSFGSTGNLQTVVFSAPVTTGNYWMAMEANGGGGSWGVLNWNNTGHSVQMANNNGGGYYNFGVNNGSCWIVEESSGAFTLTQFVFGCPGVVAFDATGATPGGQVALVFAACTGAFVVPSGPCAGTTLGLCGSGIQVVATQPADGSGLASFRGQAPSAACGRFLQAVDVSTCGTSNVVTIN